MSGPPVFKKITIAEDLVCFDTLVLASDHQHPSSSLRVDVNVREPSGNGRMKMRARKISSNDSAFSLRGRNCMNGEGSKVAAEPMIIRAIEAGTFSSNYSTLILRVWNKSMNTEKAACSGNLNSPHGWLIIGVF